MPALRAAVYFWYASLRFTRESFHFLYFYSAVKIKILSIYHGIDNEIMMLNDNYIEE